MKHASHLMIDNDEGRIILMIQTEEGDAFTFDIHSVALEFYAEVQRNLGPYAAEAQAARATLPPSYEPGEAYSADDPKHPDWHDAMADMWDRRPGK